MTEDVKKITQQEETKSEKIAQIVSRLPVSEQEKIYYMIKGVELAGARSGARTNGANQTV